MSYYSSDTDESFDTTDCESSFEEERATTYHLERFATALSVVVAAVYVAFVYTVKMAKCPLDSKRFHDNILITLAALAVSLVGISCLANVLAGKPDRNSRVYKWFCHMLHSGYSSAMVFQLGWFVVAYGSDLVPLIGLLVLCFGVLVVQMVLQLYMLFKTPLAAGDLSSFLRTRYRF